MSIHRYDARPDKAQPAIVKAIRDEGWDVYLIRLPCDVMCWHPILDRWQTLEIKTPEKNGKHYERAKDEDQRKFCQRTKTPIVWTAEMALTALSVHYAGRCSDELKASALKWREEYEQIVGAGLTAESPARFKQPAEPAEGTQRASASPAFAVGNFGCDWVD